MRWSGFIIPIMLASTAMAQTSGLVLDDFDSAINDEIGGDRAISLDVLANPFSQLTKFEVSPGYAFAAVTGAAVFNSGLGTKQTGTLGWDGGGEGLGLDAFEYGGFELDFLQADQDFSLSVEMTDFANGGSALWSGIVGATQTGRTVLISFDEFTTTGEFGPTVLDSITIVFNGGDSPISSLDFVLTEFRTSDIPAPGSVALLGLSGLLLGRRRRA